MSHAVFAEVAESAVLHELFHSTALQARSLAVPAGTVLFAPQQPADNVYLIQQGQIRLYQVSCDGDNRLTDILGPNEWVGAAALAGLRDYPVQAVAATASVVLEASAHRLLGLLGQHPHAARLLIRHLVVKLQSAREDAGRLVFDDCNQRLIKTLLRFSRSAAATAAPEGVILRITHHQLAQAVGVARETISLALTELRHQNLLQTGRNQLIFNPEALRRFAEQSHSPAASSHPAPTTSLECTAACA
jgi:CRP-like cAMP-binding protein